MDNAKKYIVPGILILVIAILIGFLFQKPSSHSNHQDQTENEHTIHDGAKKYQIELTSDMKDIKPGVLKRVTYKIKNESDQSLKNFEVVHEKIMHLVLVREDLQDFQHLHPEYDNATGEFTIDIIFNKPGPYKMFADFTPATFEDNPKTAAVVSSEKILVGNINQYKAESIIKTPSPSVEVEDYQIEYTVDAPTEKGSSYILSISKDGQPVIDLQQYLGALGHSVLLNTKTLQYYHTHAGDTHAGHSAMDMTKATKGPNIFFQTPPLEKGLYKTFTQFQHQDKVITAEYVFEVK